MQGKATVSSVKEECEADAHIVPKTSENAFGPETGRCFPGCEVGRSGPGDSDCLNREALCRDRHLYYVRGVNFDPAYSVAH